MALLTTLQIKDAPAEYKVADFRCHYARRYNQFIPESKPSCERIEITVVAPETDDYTIYEWFINRSLMSGRLSYELPVSLNHSNSERRTIDFTDARCFAFSESYDIDAQSRRLLKMAIVPEHVSIDGMAFEHL
ncbi:MAG: hypothetical protein J5552_06130 [Prevotella sp.]|nr:hypothetical protein [Prevotella sp.]